MSSNPEVPDHIKELMKQADGSSSSTAPPSSVGHVKQDRDSAGSSESSSLTDSGCKLLTTSIFLLY